jgi:Amt family ammonium transporter
VAFYERKVNGRWNLPNMCSAVLAGLVSITAPCGSVYSYSAIIIGFIGAFVYLGAVKLCDKLKVDDPVQAFPVHGACGMWGVIATALFDWGVPNGNYHAWYGFEPTPGATLGGALAVQFVAIIGIFIWTTLSISGVMIGLKSMGLLRVTKHAEEIGLDAAEFTPTRAYHTAKASAPKEAVV